MKILYHHRTLSKDGQDVHIQAMIGALSRRGHQVILVAPPPPRGNRASPDKGFSLLRQFLPRGIAEILELAYSVPAFFRLLRVWREQRPDILYERYNLLLLSGVWLRALTKIPLMLEVNSPICDERTRYGGLSWPGLARWTERQVWRQSDILLPVTQVLAGTLRAAGVPDARLHVIANGVEKKRNLTAPSPWAAKKLLGLNGKLVLGFTGFIRSWHGIPRVLRAMAALQDHPDLHLLLVGDGPGRTEIEVSAQHLGLADRVTIIGTVAHDCINRYIAAFDIALQPHVVAYASPLKLFEYMALGRAIIAPDQPNIREVLCHERDALLFDPHDPSGLESAIVRLCNDPALRTSLGAAALQTLEQGHYSWDDNARRIEELGASLRDSSRQGGVMPGATPPLATDR